MSLGINSSCPQPVKSTINDRIEQANAKLSNLLNSACRVRERILGPGPSAGMEGKQAKSVGLTQNCCDLHNYISQVEEVLNQIESEL